MPSPSSLALFAGTALILLVLPGPAVLYIVTRSVDQGRRAGLVSVLGVHTGSAVHVAAAVLGASAILATSARAFVVVKLLGAAYLICLGLRRLTARPHEPAYGSAREHRGLRRIYGQGVVVNILNPKTALFFLAFLPQFVDPRRGHVSAQVLVLGGCFITLGICSDSAYALAASALAGRLRTSERFVRRRERVSGIVCIGLGVSAALAGHPARRPVS